ncbi:MAG TPA: serine hydrolase [Ktedonobacterales bacterium]|nr:serine hydrolase [Ktedonobacterales bacterium]
MPQQTDQLPQVITRKTRPPRPLASRPWVRLGTIAVLVSLLGSGLWLVFTALQQQVTVTNGADRWASDQRATAATIPFAAPAAAQIPVDPAFSAYYQAHGGTETLGAPITAAFATQQGWMQFFSASALILPGVHQATSSQASQADQQIASLLQNGLKDRHSGVVQLPLLQSLLTVGSLASVGNGGLTYVDMRNATHPDQMTPAPATRNTPQGVFIPEGTRDGQQIGHTIPAAMWAYINRRDVSPDGWQTDFGAPLTEAMAFVDVQYGVTHRLLVQAFWRGALVMDRNASADGQPRIQPLDTGVAFLQTFAGGSHASGSVRDIPEENSPWASFAQLSPDLARYLASQSSGTAAVVYDLTRQRSYASNLDRQYLMGQTIGLPIAVAFLAMKEQQGLRPTVDETSQLKALLAANDARAEDDDAGEAIYNAIGRALGLREYLNQIGITGMTPENDDNLYSLTHPLAMVQLLALLKEGKLLTAPDRALVMSLLEHPAPDQQAGAGDTSPQGATVAMQDGWVMGTDDRWAMNTSGIVTVGGETYVISVFSAHLNALADGQDIARQVCTRVASLLH